VTGWFAYDPFGPDFLNKFFGGGVKDNGWLEKQHIGKDHGWDAIFNAAPSSGECEK
jgi:hypothetical protein